MQGNILWLRELHAAMDRAVLDACGWTDIVIRCEFLRDYGEEDDEAALEKDLRVMIGAPNWAEVRYMMTRKSGAARWAPVREQLLGLPLEIVAADQQLAERAGEIKSRHAMSLADCFAAALDRQHRAELYTGDPEFRAVEEDIRIVRLPQGGPPAYEAGSST